MAAALSTEELKLVYRGVNVGDLARVFTLEEASYPSDEGASEETLRFRIANAADYFVVACMDPKEYAELTRATISRDLFGSGEDVIVGFINGTLLPSSTLTIDALHKHEPRGATLAIHSVVIDPLLRQRGLGAAMLQHYMQRLIKHFPAVKETVLMAKVAKLGFYQRCGFRLIGPSDLVHGQEKWYELRRAHHQMD